MASSARQRKAELCTLLLDLVWSLHTLHRKARLRFHLSKMSQAALRAMNLLVVSLPSLVVMLPGLRWDSGRTQ